MFKNHVKTQASNIRSGNSFSRSQLLVFVLVFAAIGGYIVFKSLAAGSGANLYVDINGGSCTRSASLTAYNDSAACSSLNAAYAAAALGDVVMIENGTYGGQLINSTSKAPCGGQEILMQPDTGATVALGSGLEINSGCVHIKNVSAPGTTLEVADVTGMSCATSPVQDVTVENYTAAVFQIYGPVNGTTIQGGSYGPSVDTHNVIANFGGSQPDPCNTKIYDANIHDVSTSGTPGVHTECFQIFGGTPPVNLDIERTNFGPCPIDNGTGTVTAAVSLGSADGLTFKNNVVGHGDSGLILGPNIRNLDFSYNTIYSDIGWFSGGCTAFGGSCGPYVFKGNILGGIYYGSCPEHSSLPTYTWRYNVVVDIGLGDCGSAVNDIVVSNWASIGYVDYPNGDFHITSSSPAKGAGDPTSYPPVDIDGQTRTSPPDAGSDQISGVNNPPPAIPGDVNSDGHVTITDLSILLSHFSQSGQSLATGDCNADGSVTILDLSILLSHFGQ